MEKHSVCFQPVMRRYTIKPSMCLQSPDNDTVAWFICKSLLLVKKSFTRMHPINFGLFLFRFLRTQLWVRQSQKKLTILRKILSFKFIRTVSGVQTVSIFLDCPDSKTDTLLLLLFFLFFFGIDLLVSSTRSSSSPARLFDMIILITTLNNIFFLVHLWCGIVVQLRESCQTEAAY